MTEIGTKVTYRGKVVAEAESVRPIGINYEVRYSSGYTVVLPPSAMSADLLAMTKEV